METVTLDTGTFTATIYEPFMTPSNAAPGTGVQVGANIKLVFTPKIDRAASQTIRLIQFKLPLNPTVWAVDRNAAFQSPYFGIDNNGNPLELDLSNVRGSDSLKKEKYRSAKGGVTTGKSTREAYLVDPPRENRNLPANANGRLEALFTAYAYDVSNGTWLGGVSWGYAASINGGVGTASLLKLSLRSKGHPPGHFPAATPTMEASAATNWNAVAGNNPVPPW